MRSATLVPDPAVLTVEQIVPEAATITLVARTTRPIVCCPDCGHPTDRVHSWYTRELTDLPWQGLAVRLHLHTRRWFCDDPDCTCHIFTERLPTVAMPHGRRTTRLATIVLVFGVAVGGVPGARLLDELGIVVSGDTLRRAVRNLDFPVAAMPRVLGVDDWSLRKGRTYGTILVDLERHCPIDLLPDAQAATFAAWLQAHPGVEIICRDRGGAYADGARQGAPDAIQIADRWHLLANLGDLLERLLVRQHAALQQVRLDPPDAAPNQPGRIGRVDADPGPAPADLLSHKEADRQQRVARREARYQAIHALQQHGYGIRAIARQLGIHPATVRKNLAAARCPHPGPRPHRRRRITPFVPYLRERWEAGERQTKVLWAEIREQGFIGSWKRVQEVVAPWRQAEYAAQHDVAGQGGASPLPRPTRRQGKRCAPRQVAAWLVRSPEELHPAQQYLAALGERWPELAEVQRLAADFAHIVRTRAATELTPWLATAEHSDITEFREFAASIRRDEAAVQAALDFPWSSGQVEGQVNRLKLIKRSMYGRAGFDLLRRRVVRAA